VRVDLEKELKYSESRSIRGQVVRLLLDHVQFELPETPVANVTRNVVYDIVQDNTRRGISREMIEEQKDAIYSSAAANAKDRVKLMFLVQRIAEKEKISVTQDDVLMQARMIAATNQIPLDQFLKDLQKRDGVRELYDQALHEKIIEFLEKNAKVETVPAKPAGP
jgi:trigger factor